MTQLCTKKCVPCEGGTPALSSDEATPLLKEIGDWEVDSDNTTISKVFQFKGFGKTMSFVNAVAWIANQEGHHPDMEVSFNRCKVNFTTHAANGLTENDFICAAKVNALMGG